MMRALLLSAAGLCLLYIGAGAALFFLQRRLIFAGDKTYLPPSDVGLPEAETHRLETKDDVSLIAWLVRRNPERIFIYFHGNGGSLPSRATRIKQLANFGFSVLAIDYRGFGGSDGAPSEVGLLRDADAAYDFAHGLGYTSAGIVVFGESLGTGVAVSLASQRDVAGVILDSAFSSMADIAVDRYWMFPFPWLLRDPFRSDRKIGSVRAPILILHGTNDEVVPLRYAEKLFSHARNDTEFVTIDAAGHIVFPDEKAQARITSWLVKLFAELQPER